MSAPTWRVVPNAYGATLVVDHACGHLERYLYGGAEFALKDTTTQQAPNCLQCHSRAMQKRYEKLTGTRLAPDSETTP